MSDNIIYEMLVNEHNQKENDLIAKIKFYKENKDQLLRIKMLEEELTSLEKDLNTEHSIKMREVEETKLKDKYIKIILENCKDAYQMYQLNKRNSNRRPNIVQIYTLCKTYYINYTFKEINEKEYDVSANIPSFPMLSMNIYDKFVNGIYHIENGLTIKT